MDAQINRLITARDYKGALTAIVAAHGLPLGRFCGAALGSLSEGEEALQDTLVAALASMPSYRGDGVRAWVFGIARKVTTDALRKRARRRGLWARFFGGNAPVARVTDDSVSYEVGSPHPPLDGLEKIALQRSLARLSPKLSEALLLRYQQGMDATEVADVLGISHAAARKRLSLAILALRNDLLPGDGHEDSLRSSEDSAVVRS